MPDKFTCPNCKAFTYEDSQKTDSQQNRDKKRHGFRS